MGEFSRVNHYVPTSYFRGWATPGVDKLYAYQILVPSEGVLPWSFRHVASIGFHRDLYTSYRDGKESDRIEKWLNQEVETPAQEVLQKISSGRPLDTTDRKRLARYVAALDARSPLGYSQYTQAMSKHIEGVLGQVLESTVARLEQINRDKAGSVELADDVAVEPSHSLAVKINRGDPDTNVEPTLEVNVVMGREYWLDNIEHIVNDLSQLLENLDWRAYAPHAGWTWPTSDHPVIRLNYYEDGTYNFGGGYGFPGTEILLPLSPAHLLIARVGKPASKNVVLSLEQTVLIKRFVAEHAFRWIVSAKPSQSLAWIRPRVVDLAAYNAEQQGWSRFHSEQSAAEEQIRS